MPKPPLPIRDGLGPSRIRLPDPPVTHSTVLAYLTERFPADAHRIREKIDAGEVVDAAGVPIDDATPVTPRADIYLYRDPPNEPVVPFAIDILYRDRSLVVVDKPHFLATTPRGRFVVQTALVRLRRELEIPELSPAHRLDRLTAGVLLFTVRPEVRRAYQEMFRDRTMTKTYEAVAPYRPHLAFPRTVASRIIKDRSSLQAMEVSGEPNAVTDIDIVRHDGNRALYRLHPHTGKTHQLRVHMNSLGLPIEGDPLYPDVTEVAADDYRSPLRLLARSIEFVDPLTAERRRFSSSRSLPW
ncbi:pseudouridylate synthase [Rhodococcoides trifolii]|uniref:RNA pseudouridylate synthase n=1 Tax=Rhodococcoides trifolii TaxID=908250 RepID=A0A917LGY0_9NOCA|nr:pseudouridine synthase [Rhodococcus trifolii]GGG22696.1 pseudouridylate synthase [Rhodococcus trifolii]